ncbi:MAG: UDP-glucose/GDP-mannose dehydrogenase family protein [Methanobrevibacter sp.]|jgi:UDPglucose 6-dehydrogenase|nr:UDP-glucose/GDP-mannose dehydrogenase family protein [Candidatus Methanovirga meridionalis]
MKVVIIGTGHVGLPIGVYLAEIGHDVVCVDKVETIIDSLNNGKITFLFEEGLEELFQRNFKSNKIKFTTSFSHVNDADVVIISVGTSKHVYNASTKLAEYLKGYTVIAIKSTVPVGCNDEIENLIAKVNPEADFDVVSLPEFLREGFAVFDSFNPDRIIIGTESERPISIIKELYGNCNKEKLFFVSRRSAEAIKYASNSFLAMKIHFINEMSDFCKEFNASIREVAEGMGLDKRIGDEFLTPGPGYGGFCFPKDTHEILNMAKNNGVNLSLIETTIKNNKNRMSKLSENILYETNKIKANKIAILGLTFKGGTDDCRNSPAITIINLLLKHFTYNIITYDPKGMKNAKNLLGNKVDYGKDVYDTVKGADVLVILTDWMEFKKLDLRKLKSSMNHHIIIDLRNMIDKNKALKLGFTYIGL